MLIKMLASKKNQFSNTEIVTTKVFGLAKDVQLYMRQGQGTELFLALKWKERYLSLKMLVYTGS